MPVPRLLALLLGWTMLGSSALVVLTGSPAAAETTTVPGTLSTTAMDTSSLTVHVPRGVRPTAITAVLTQPEIVNGGLVAVLINGRVVRTIPSTLYQKISVPVSPSDVVADDTINLALRSTGPPIGNICRPDAGSAMLRKVALRYDGRERAPRTLATFFPPATSRFDVLIAPDADVAVQQAALVAIAALSSRYPAGTDIRLTTTDRTPERGVATQRALRLETGRPAEVTTDVGVAANGVPTLTITATGDELAAAVRALALALPGDPLLNNPDLVDLSAELEPRRPDLDLTLADLVEEPIRLAGYGVRTRSVALPQDVFASRVSGLTVHLEGSTSAIADPDRARVDVRFNGKLVGSQALAADGRLVLDFTVPAADLDSVNRLEVQLSAVTPSGAACAGAGVPPVEVDIDRTRSTVVASPGTGDERGFQQLPQVLGGQLPVAIRTDDPSGAAPISSLQDAAGLVAALQDAAAFPLDVELIAPEAFVAGERSGMLVGATTGDADGLGAPLALSSIRVLDRADSTLEITSQEPYAALEAFTSDGREVLLLGGWAPEGTELRPAYSRKLVKFVTKNGWPAMTGDLLLADATSAPFLLDSQALQPEDADDDAEDEGNRYAKWFILGALLLVLALAVQVGLVLRRDRRTPRSEDAAEGDDLGVIPDEPPGDDPLSP